jgi:hypothetical protein
VVEILLSGNKCFGQTGLQIPRIQREVENRYAGIAKAVGEIRLQQTTIGSDVNPEAFLRRVLDNFVNELWAQARLATYQREHTAPVVVQPVDRTPRHVLGHALDFVVVRPAIPAIEVALVFDKQISGDGWNSPGKTRERT